MSEQTKNLWPFSRGQTVFIVVLLILFGIFVAYLQWNSWADRMIQTEIDRPITGRVHFPGRVSATVTGSG